MNTKKYQLPKEFGEKWVKALRSGEYKLGRGAYYNKETNCYCGLGISALIAECTPLYGSIKLNGNEWPIDFKLKNEIIHLNDDLKYTFEQQADWLEQNVNFI